MTSILTSDWSSADHKKLIRGVLMTACDLGAITKPWEIQQKIATLIADEFFYQASTRHVQDVYLKIYFIP